MTRRVSINAASVLVEDSISQLVLTMALAFTAVCVHQVSPGTAVSAHTLATPH